MANTANYVKLETITVGEAGAASVTFNNLNSLTAYTDLKIVCSTRTATAAVGDALWLSFNSGGSTLSGKRLYGNGASAASDTDYYGAWDTGANATTNTFGNTEFYIPNFAGSNAKSFSSDSVSENNGTTAYASMIAHLSSNTAPITKIVISTESGASFVQYSTFSLYGLAAVGTTPVIAPYASGGDIIETDGTYWYHAFLSSGTFIPAKALSCDVLVVAGGGAGNGDNPGGGGGAGGLRVISGSLFTLGTAYAATIGAGGSGAGPSGVPGAAGSNSSINSIAASGGGGGGGGNGAAGGSGGGGGVSNGTASSGAGNAGSYSPVEGYAGGSASASSGNYSTGGGGGAGGVGAPVSTNGGGNGGVGTYTYNSINFSSWLSTAGVGVLNPSDGFRYLAGGGGGGAYNTTNPGTGGIGGGGNGTYRGAGIAGVPNTGSGGGGGYNGGKGGSGIVIVRYAI